MDSERASSSHDCADDLGEGNPDCSGAMLEDQNPKQREDLEPYKLEQELSLSLFNKFQQSGEIADLRGAIVHARDAVRLYQYNDKQKRTLFVNLGNMQYMLYRSTDELHTLDEAVFNIRSGFRISFEEEPKERLSLLQNFWLVLKEKVALTGTLELIKEAIEVAGEILNMPVRNKEYLYRALGPKFFQQLYTLYLKKFELADDLSNLDEAVMAAENAAQFAMHDDPNKDVNLLVLTLFLDRRFRVTRMEDDSNRSIQIRRELVDHPSPATRSSPSSMCELALIFYKRHQLTGDAGDIEEAIRIGREACEFLKGDGDFKNESDIWRGLAISLAERFNILGRTADLEEAIRCGHEAVTTAKSSSDRVQCLNNLATLYADRYEAQGKVSDIDTAVRMARQLLDGGISDDRARSALFGNLSTWLQHIYCAKGALIDLREAIHYGRESLQEDSTIIVDRIILMSNLAQRLGFWYMRTKDLSALREAITLSRQAIEDAGLSHPYRTLYLNNLANFLSDSFLETHRPEEIEEALDLGEKALTDAPVDLLMRPNFLSCQGARFYSKYEHSSSNSDLDNAISFTRDATRAVGRHQPDSARFLSNLGQLLWERAKKYNGLGDRDEAKSSLHDAFDNQVGPLVARIGAGQLAGYLHGQDREWFEAYDVLQSAVILLKKVSPRSIARVDQQENLAGLSGISALACSVALEAGKSVADSLDILEAGRAIISSLLTQMSEDLARLAKIDPEICDKYKLLREQVHNIELLEISSEGNVEASQKEPKKITSTPVLHRGQQHVYTATREHFRIMGELDNLEEEIRGLPGMDRFQLAPSSDQIMSMIESRPLICFNVTEFRSDAITITKSGMSVLRLDELLYPDLEKRAKLLTGKDRITSGRYLGSRAERNSLLLEILEWLWKVAVRPVLNSLGLLTMPKTTPLAPPRVYWMASGLMGTMPLHAAGIHHRGTMDNAMSHVVSTYVTNLKGFAYAKEKASKRFNLTEETIYVVTMPTTPGKSPLKVAEEAEAIRNVCAKFKLPKPNTVNHPSKSDVKANIMQRAIVHFACHGNSNASNPSKGGLYFGGEHDSIAEHLSVAELSNMRPQHAQLAYLSACSTAENLSEKLVDEAIHTAGSFQLLGFPNVIATLWEADNMGAIQVARTFYESLSARAPEGSEDFPGDIALSLHKALHSLKENGTPGLRKRSDPRRDALSWAPFIHVGV